MRHWSGLRLGHGSFTMAQDCKAHQETVSIQQSMFVQFLRLSVPNKVHNMVCKQNGAITCSRKAEQSTFANAKTGTQEVYNHTLEVPRIVRHWARQLQFKSVKSCLLFPPWPCLSFSTLIWHSFGSALPAGSSGFLWWRLSDLPHLPAQRLSSLNFSSPSLNNSGSTSDTYSSTPTQPILLILTLALWELDVIHTKNLCLLWCDLL